MANTFITGSLRLKPNNVVTSLTNQPWPQKVTAQAGDRPYFTITETSERIVNRNVMPTFSNSNSAIGDVNINKELMFTIIVEWDSLDRNRPNQFKTVFEAILLSNPTLGFTGIPIRSSGQFTATNEEKPSTIGGQTRKILVQTIRFPVTALLNRAGLVANAAYTGT